MLFNLFENSVPPIWICDSNSSIEFIIISIRISDINIWYHLFEYVISHIVLLIPGNTSPTSWYHLIKFLTT